MKWMIMETTVIEVSLRAIGCRWSIRAAPGILWILLAKAPTLPKDQSLIVQMEHIAGGVESIANKLIYRVKLYFIASRA
jgi:hypothetical protein